MYNVYAAVCEGQCIPIGKEEESKTAYIIAAKIYQNQPRNLDCFAGMSRCENGPAGPGRVLQLQRLSSSSKKLLVAGAWA